MQKLHLRNRENCSDNWGQLCEPITADLDGWKVVAGKPSMKTWILHTSADGSMISGCWEAKPGTYHATYTAYEFVHLIKGKITITPDGGMPVNVGPGDAFVVEPGFKGTWKIREKVFKHFDIKLKLIASQLCPLIRRRFCPFWTAPSAVPSPLRCLSWQLALVPWGFFGRCGKVQRERFT